jgi:hypothetical protein
MQNRPDKRPLTRTAAWSEHDRPLADYSFKLAVYSFFDTHGLSRAEVARRLDVPLRTVQRWVKDYGATPMLALPKAPG